jgi:hypothetical protein
LILSKSRFYGGIFFDLAARFDPNQTIIIFQKISSHEKTISAILSFCLCSKLWTITSAISTGIMDGGVLATWFEFAHRDSENAE